MFRASEQGRWPSRCPGRPAWIHIAALAWLLAASVALAPAQVIEFESGGLKYKTLTRQGLTVMFADLGASLRDYAIVQVAISNGSGVPARIRVNEFVIQRADGTETRAVDPETVIGVLVDRGSRDDVVKLVTAYENGLYGVVKFRSTNGFEQRRQAAIAEVSSPRLKAAAAASAIVLVDTLLKPGASTDGVIFFPLGGRRLQATSLVVTAGGERFEFPIDHGLVLDSPHPTNLP